MPNVPDDIFQATTRLQQTRASAAPAPSPLGLCLAALIVNGLGLTAAILAVQWGADPPRSDALPLAWCYVNVGLAAGWFLLWPAFVLRPHLRSAMLDTAALVLAALPALAAAAWLSQVTAAILLRTLVLQVAFALFVLGLLSRHTASPRREALMAAILAGLFGVLPLIAYVLLEFWPATGSAWHACAPPLALVVAAAPAAPTGLWWVAVAYALAGAILLALPRPRTDR